MTPKEKAEELVFKYWGKGITNVKKIAKQCALIAVDEIMRAIPDAGDDDSPYNHELIWWQEVKKEIENL